MKTIILPQKECIREHPKPQYFLRASASTARRGSLYGAKASVSGSRCNLLWKDNSLHQHMQTVYLQLLAQNLFFAIQQLIRRQDGFFDCIEPESFDGQGETFPF